MIETLPIQIDWFVRLFDSFYGFITFMIFVSGGIAIASASMALASYSAYMTFAYFAITTGDQLLEQILYVTLVLIFVGFAFKFWRLEGMGGGSES